MAVALVQLNMKPDSRGVPALRQVEVQKELSSAADIITAAEWQVFGTARWRLSSAKLSQAGRV
jgi:hypothetical protein